MATGKKTGGRKSGTPNKATTQVRDLAGDYGPDALKELNRLATTAQSEQARVSACNSILDRAYGKASFSSPIRLDLPDISTADALVQAINAVAAAAAATGSITPADARDLGSIMEGQRRALETTDLAERMTPP